MSVSEVDPEPETVAELTGRESGVWRVITRDSVHVFDFDMRTVTRFPGHDAVRTVNDRPREIWYIEICQVGKRGRWKMEHGGYFSDIDFYWADTSVIQRIERFETVVDEDTEA